MWGQAVGLLRVPGGQDQQLLPPPLQLYPSCLGTGEMQGPLRAA